jgi:hypothetical protein
MAFSHDSGFDDSITASQPDSSWLLERCDTWAREQALATEMDVSTPFYEVDEDFQVRSLVISVISTQLNERHAAPLQVTRRASPEELKQEQRARRL